MLKYWKLIGAVLAVIVLAVVMVAAVPAAKPDQGGGAQLFTLLDEETVPSGVVSIESAYVDVSKFSEFRVFTKVTSLSAGGTIRFRLTESVDGEVDSLSSPTGNLNHLLSGFPNFPPFDFSHNVLSHPYRYLKVEVLENSSGDAHTFSVFLHAKP